MKTYKKIPRQYEETVVDKVTCDICKKEYIPNNFYKERYGFTEVVVHSIVGNKYPDDKNFGVKVEYDICPKCFGTTFRDFMLQFGAEEVEQDVYL